MDLGRLAPALRGRRRTYHTILKLADHALSKMVRYVLLRPELDDQDPFQICEGLCQTRKTPNLGTLFLLIMIRGIKFVQLANEYAFHCVVHVPKVSVYYLVLIYFTHMQVRLLSKSCAVVNLEKKINVKICCCCYSRILLKYAFF
jgi:hypothetical protein